MNFTSLNFLIFFTVTAIGWYILPEKIRKFWLLAASYFFYMSAAPAFGLLLLAGTAVSFLTAQATQRTFLGRRTLWTAIGVVYTLGALFLFKYFDFLCTTLWGLAGAEYSGLKLALPIGISFFSFAVSGYLFDVHRGKLEAEKNFFDYALFVSFFPCLLAGPIGKAREFLPQLRAPLPAFDGGRLRRGALRFVCGAVKKMVIADLLAVFVDAAYAQPDQVSGGVTFLAAVFYSLQIYFDFSGYSDMAIGTADALGFRVTENFRAPYLSTSVKGFWKKWHISLTGWFREYLYFPLGGSRKGKLRTLVNVLIVYAVSGLWHGAAWTFVIWGLLNGLYQVAESLAESALNRLKGPVWAVIRGVIAFGLITVAWVFFRADSFDQAMYIIKHTILILRDGFGWASVRETFSIRAALVILVSMIPFVWSDIRLARGKAPLTLENRPVLYWASMLILLLIISVFGVYGEGFDPKEFVYFRF